MRKNKKMRFLVSTIIILCIVGFSNQVFAMPVEPGPREMTYYPTSYSLDWPSTIISGDLNSVRHYNDGDSMVFKAGWLWLIQYSFSVYANFYYPNVPAENLRFGFTDNCDTARTYLRIYYSDGSYDFYPERPGNNVSDGYWLVDLAPGKLLNSVRINFSDADYFLNQRYLNLDVCTGVTFY